MEILVITARVNSHRMNTVLRPVLVGVRRLVYRIERWASASVIIHAFRERAGGWLRPGTASGSMNFYLGIWSSESAPSDKDAAERYAALAAGQDVPTGFNAAVYAFYIELTSHYLDIEMVAEEERDSCPWACALEVSGVHVIMAMRPDKYANVFPLVLQLADRHGLVCFDPQNAKVHLPSRLPHE